MDVSKDPRIVQYANTITGLPDYHIMKEALESVFGENEKVSFENVEEMRGVIVDTYTESEYGLLTQGLDDLTIGSTQKDDEEEKKESKPNGPTPEEITSNLSKDNLIILKGIYLLVYSLLTEFSMYKISNLYSDPLQ